MGERRFIDFDKAWEEAAATAPVIRVFGEDITLPPATPARVYVLRARWVAEDPHAGLTDERILEILRCYFGDRVDRWIDETSINADQLADMFVRVDRLYAAERRSTAAEGEAPPPATGAGSPT